MSAVADIAPGGAAAMVWRWAHDACVAPSASTVDLARTWLVDLDTALWPPNAARGCSILARVTTDYPQSDAVQTVLFSLQPLPAVHVQPGGRYQPSA